MKQTWKIIIGVVIVAIVVSGGAYFWPLSKEQSNSNSPTLVEAFSIQGLSFTLPSGWSLDKIENHSSSRGDWQEATIKVPDPKYHVSIPMGIGKIDQVPTGSSLLKTTASGAKIYDEFCAPGIACYYLAYQGATYYITFGDPISNEPIPANLDSVWAPSTTVTDKDTLNFVATVTKAETSNLQTDTQKTLQEYFTTRNQFLNSTMAKDNTGINKTPEALRFKELAQVEVTCSTSSSLGTPCEGTLFILSKDSLHSGSQEFYLAFSMGTGYTYYGPFTNDLQKIVNESGTIKSLERTN